MYDIEAKEKPRWYDLRRKISTFFIRVARWIHPRNPDVTAFQVQLMTDAMIYGRAVVRVNPMDEFKETDAV